MSRDYYRGLNDRSARPHMADALAKAAETPWWHVSTTGEIREATGADRIPPDWVGFPDKAKAEAVAADRKRNAEWATGVHARRAAARARPEMRTPGETPAGLGAAVAALLQDGGHVWLVDSAGLTHKFDVQGYARLTAAQVEGSHVFLSEESAAAFVAAGKETPAAKRPTTR